VLTYWPASKDSVRILNAIVADPLTDSDVQQSAAFALRQRGDSSSGAALLAGLKLTPPENLRTARSIADALGHLRYRPAGAEILARLSGEPERHFQELYAGILADLRYQPAVAAIQALCKTAQIDAEWVHKQSPLGGGAKRLPEISLVRIVGPWGPESGGLRLLLMPPLHPASGGRVLITALMENTGDKDTLRDLAGVWIIDGKEYPDNTSVREGLVPVIIGPDGNRAREVLDLDVRTVDVTDRLSATAQTHTIVYRLLGASSNVLSITVR
jgi:hypothetical protein